LKQQQVYYLKDEWCTHFLLLSCNEIRHEQGCVDHKPKKIYSKLQMVDNFNSILSWCTRMKKKKDPWSSIATLHWAINKFWSNDNYCSLFAATRVPAVRELKNGCLKPRKRPLQTESYCKKEHPLLFFFSFSAKEATISPVTEIPPYHTEWW